MYIKEKNLFVPIVGITIGLVLVILPFFLEVKKSLILLGIVPLWIGFYYIYHLFLNSDNKNRNEEVNS